MTDLQHTIDIYRYLSGDPFHVFCLYTGITIFILAALTFWKKRQRVFLWTVAIVIIEIIMALGVLGILDVNDSTDSLVFILGVICPSLYACAAEKLYSKQKANSMLSQEIIAEVEPTDQVNETKVEEESGGIAEDSQSPHSVMEDQEIGEAYEEEESDYGVIPRLLATDLALEVFAKAKADGFITEGNGHFVWQESQVLLAYMCGRIYCGDYPELDKVAGFCRWKQGKYKFPETALNKLFNLENLGQSRRNRVLLSCPDRFDKIDTYFPETESS